MTIVFAIKENENSILIAADSENLESGVIRMFNDVKLQKHSTLPVAWACSGSSSLAIEFGSWLVGYIPQTSTWKIFLGEISKSLSTMNGERRGLLQLARKEPTENDLCSALLIGWINDVPGIYEFDVNGIPHPYWQQGFQAIGSGKNDSYIAYYALDSLPKIQPLTKLEIIMKVVTEHRIGCNKPIYIWRVTRGEKPIEVEVIEK